MQACGRRARRVARPSPSCQHMGFTPSCDVTADIICWFTVRWSRQQCCWLTAGRFSKHEQRSGYGPPRWLKSHAHSHSGVRQLDLKPGNMTHNPARRITELRSPGRRSSSTDKPLTAWYRLHRLINCLRCLKVYRVSQKWHNCCMPYIISTDFRICFTVRIMEKICNNIIAIKTSSVLLHYLVKCHWVGRTVAVFHWPRQWRRRLEWVVQHAAMWTHWTFDVGL